MRTRPKPGERCQHCGADHGLEVTHLHVGGQGPVRHVLCMDSESCNRRWDDKNIPRGWREFIYREVKNELNDRKIDAGTNR